MLNLRFLNTAVKRRTALEKQLRINLGNIGRFSLDEKQASSRNCENMIGAAQVPLGIAGPIRLVANAPRSGQAKREKKYFIPLATTEGALVASVNRGCKAINQSGGASVMVDSIGATRGPVFKTSGINQSLKFTQWLDNNFSVLAKIAVSSSQHLHLMKLETKIAGKYVFVRFYFDTGDAMGMNMVTLAADRLVKLIETKTGTDCISLAGNFDIDKKPAWLNSIAGRGKSVWAEVLLPASVIKQTLKTSSIAMYQVWLAKCMIGSAMSGSIGFNAQYANVVAAIFIATGQDPAHVVEGSMGITSAEVIQISNLKSQISKPTEDNLYINVYLPSLMVGTVGGGTRLATQKEALQILGLAGGNEGQNAVKLAEVVGAAVLAGEISLLASLAEGSLAKAHQRLGRSKKNYEL